MMMSFPTRKKKNQRVYLWNWMAQLEFEIMCSQWTNTPKIIVRMCFFSFIFFHSVRHLSAIRYTFDASKGKEIKCVRKSFKNGLWWNELNARGIVLISGEKTSENSQKNKPQTWSKKVYARNVIISVVYRILKKRIQTNGIHYALIHWFILLLFLLKLIRKSQNRDQNLLTMFTHFANAEWNVLSIYT